MSGLLFWIGVYYTFRGLKRAVLNVFAGRAPWHDAHVPQARQAPHRRMLSGSRPEDV